MYQSCLVQATQFCSQIVMETSSWGRSRRQRQNHLEEQHPCAYLQGPCVRPVVNVAREFVISCTFADLPCASILALNGETLPINMQRVAC